jgi:hypothetical protein
MGEKGTLYNYPDVKVEKPCEECVLVGMSRFPRSPHCSPKLKFPQMPDLSTLMDAMQTPVTVSGFTTWFSSMSGPIAWIQPVLVKPRYHTW